MRQACSVPAQPFPPVPLERGCKLSEPHVRQLNSQGFFVHCLLNHSPSWSIFSLVMHYLQMLVETKLKVLWMCPLAFRLPHRIQILWSFYAKECGLQGLFYRQNYFPGLPPENPGRD